MQKLGSILKMMEQALPELGAASDAGKALLDAMSKISKFVPNGSVTPAAQKNSIEAQQRNMAQNNQQMQAIQAMKQKMAQGGGGGQPPQGAAA
jgi:hypothetical protein